MNPFRRSARGIAGSIGLVAVLLGLTAAPALAAPAFDVQLTRSASEAQVVFVKAGSGQFRLNFGSGGPGVSETGDLSFNATSEQVQSALNGLANVNAGGGSVVVEERGVSPEGGGYYEVSFSSGPLANTDVPQLIGSDGTTPLGGGGSRVVVTTIFQAEVSRSDDRLGYIATVKNSGANPTNSTVTLEVELPPGQANTVVFSFGILGTGGEGWTCSAQPPVGPTPAKAICTRSDALPPGASYPPLRVIGLLGPDTPDPTLAKATVSGGGATTVSDSEQFGFTPAKTFGISSFDSEVIGADGADYTQAGGHPFSAGISFGITNRKSVVPAPLEQLRRTLLDLPRGMVGNALAVPVLCPSVEDVFASTCPPGSAVGEINVDVTSGLFPFGAGIKMPIFAIVPERGLPAQFSFAELSLIQTAFSISPHLRADDGYGITLDTSAPPGDPPIRRLNEGMLCSFGAKVTGNQFKGCREATDPAANPVPLITNPTRCAGAPPVQRVSISSLPHPNVFVSAEVNDPSNDGCGKVDFQPEVSIQPTNKQADSPTGVDVDITMPTAGLESKTGLAQANLDNAIVTLPKGMSLNPAAAHGLGSCSPALVKLGSNDEDECPLSSEVGTIEIDTPLIRNTLKGHVFLASQNDNPLKATLGLYLVFASKEDGVTIKVAGKLQPDPVTGQLTSSFVQNPEAPFSRLAIKFNSGPRAPLINPPKCGTYAIHSELSPWSAASPANPTPEEIVPADSTYQVTSGPNGSPCPTGTLDPNFQAGLKNATAGSKSPFVVKLSREDGSQRLTALDLDMPAGFTAYLKGIPYCPEHVLAGISGAELTGRPELASPACPAASQVGTVQAGAGAGPYPFYASGRVFLAGPYKGAPLSFAVVSPAVAGPFDFGNVVVRNAVYIDPATAQVTVKSDPIPTIVEPGILLDIRDIRVNIDREGFAAAPTNCKAQAIGARIGGEGDASTTRSNYFQVSDCAALGFKPKLALRLFGGTKRGAHPRLRAVLTARPGDADIAGASVALPHSEFLDQAHIRTVCTRVQFKANECPAGAVYGHAEAVTPLLDNPLSGPVYLRSSDNPLPDLVAALRGPDNQPIEVVLAGRVDSVRGGIRTTFEAVPDQPVSTFTLNMQGGKKGLLVNSRDICKSVNRATAEFSGQNGRKATLRPQLQNSCKRTASKTHKRHSSR